MKNNTAVTLKRIFRLVPKAVGIYAFLAPVYYLVEGIFPAVMTAVNAQFFDYAVRFFDSDGNGFHGAFRDSKALWWFTAAMIGIYLVRGVLTFAGSVAINMGIYERLASYLKICLADKTSRLNLIDFENTAIYNQNRRAEECLKKEQISAAYMITVVLFSCGFSVIAATCVLAAYSIWIIPVAFFSVLPYFLNYRLLGENFYRMQKEQTPVKRRAAYLWNTLTNPRSVRELRITDSAAYIEDKWNDYNSRMQYEMYQHRKREARNLLVCSMVRTLGTGISISLSLYLTIHGKITIGEFGACIAAYAELQNKAREFFTEFGRFKEKVNFSADYFEFMDLPEEREAAFKPDGFPERIEMKNVSFYYPNGERKALDSINLEITRGESIAIIGENGSGKTTLTKVLTGLYCPDSGQVLYDNRDLQTMDAAHIRKSISVISQNFVKYFLTLRENIAISNPLEIDDDEKILKCLEEAGIPASKEDLDKPVGKMFGGREFSGGQWQRIAIARALFRPAELFIMDEPTSALDPVLESEILKKFLKVLREKTCIIVSHRIGLCRYADKIVVMKNGRIAEVGNHKELYQKKGEYWAIFNSQSRWYDG